MYKHTCLLALLLLAATAPAAGCAAYQIDPPPGFVEVSGSSWETRMKAQDNVGLRVVRSANVRGGTLGFWASDLVTKLGKRGYTLVGQQEISTKNRKRGTRFDFEYTPPGTETAKFFTIALFVTDKYKVTLDLAGNKEHAKTYQARVGEIAGELKVRGCKAASKVCNGEQPPRLKSPPPDPVPGLPEPEPPKAQPPGV